MNTFPWKITLSILALLLNWSVSAQNATEIVEKSEEVRRGVQSAYAEMTMQIIRPDWSRKMSLKSWSKGDDYALILVTAPARDQGTANLKRKKEVWSWVPRIERTIKLPPSMMSQSWMGSDFKNEDLINENSIVEDYTHKILRTETIQDRPSWVIELIPREDAAVIWGKVLMWVDKKDYLQLKVEFYDEEMELVNTMIASDIKIMDDRLFATRLEMIPADEEGYKTVMIYNELEFDNNISESFFTLQNMKNVR